MNYILEINAFYDWLQTNQLSKSAIALWHALMHINNKANWSDRFTVATSILEYNTGFKKSEIFKGRNELAQKGRIKWFARGGNLSAEYQIISFCVHNTDANGNANGTQTVTQMVTINKLNKTKQNVLLEKEPKSEFSGEAEVLESDNPPQPQKRKKVAPKKEKFDFRQAMLDEGFDEELTDEWLRIRKVKKAVNSEMAFKNFMSQVEKSSQNKKEILRIITESQWKGFRSHWIKNNENEQYSNNSTYKGNTSGGYKKPQKVSAHAILAERLSRESSRNSENGTIDADFEMVE